MRSRLLALLACSALVVALTPSQALAQAKTTFGIEGGINVANVDFTTSDTEDGVPSFDSRTRGVGGFFVAVDFNRHAGLQIEALYSQRGAKASFSDSDGSFEVEASLDYIEIPVLFRANMPASDAVTFRVFAGPAFGIKVKDDLKLTLNGEDFSDQDDTQWKSYDLSLVVGAAAQFGPFFVDGRYSWGMINVLDEDTDEIKGRTFSFMVGIAFN